LPVCYGACRSFLYSLSFLQKQPDELSVYFICGVIAYFILQIIFFKPMRIYVFGHELTHVIAGWLSGARVKSFSVKKTGGSVGLSKTNVMVSLSPYFIPIYALLLIAVYFILGQVFNLTGYHNIFLFFLGMSISFHLVLTVFALTQGQSDLKKSGQFFSLVFILIMNCIVISSTLSIFLPFRLKDFFINMFKYSRDSYVWIYRIVVNKALEVI